MFKNREVIKHNGHTFSIMQFTNKSKKWNLVLEYSDKLNGNRVFNSKEECIRFIKDFK